MGLIPFVLLLALLTPIVIILAVIIYKSMYRRHINQALTEDGNRIQFIEPFNFLVIVILIVLTIFSIINYSGLKQTSENFYNSQNLINNNINSKYNSLQSQIDKLQKKLYEMEERSRWIIDKNFKFVDLTEDKQRMIVEINTSLRELESNQVVYLVITDKMNVSNTTKIPLDHQGTLSFSKQIELNTQKNYLIELLTDNGTTIKKEKLFDIDLNELLKERITSKGAGFEKGNEDNTLDYQLYLGNRYYGIESYKITKITILFYENSTLIDQKEITNEVARSTIGEEEHFKYSDSIQIKTGAKIHIEIILEDSNGFVEKIGPINLFEGR